MKLHVEVTAEDIAAGVKEDGQSCPIALAMQRCSGVLHVDVGEQLRITTDALEYQVFAPLEAATFMDQFDSGETVAPFAFDVEVGADDVFDATAEEEPDEDLGDEEVSL